MAEHGGMFVINDGGSRATVHFGGKAHGIGPGESLQWTDGGFSPLNVFDPGPLPPPIKVLSKAVSAPDLDALRHDVEVVGDEVLVVHIHGELNLDGVEQLAHRLGQGHNVLVFRMVE